MKFGLKYFGAKTPLVIKRISLALKTGSAAALTYVAVTGNAKYLLWASVAGIVGTMLASLCAEQSLNDQAGNK